MAGKPPPTRPGKQSDAEAREARLKQALKANMGRRKAQAKARSAQEKSSNEGEEQ